MLVAGKDATELFYKTHSWVNYESLLSTSIVGYLDLEELKDITS